MVVMCRLVCSGIAVYYYSGSKNEKCMDYQIQVLTIVFKKRRPNIYWAYIWLKNQFLLGVRHFKVMENYQNRNFLNGYFCGSFV